MEIRNVPKAISCPTNSLSVKLKEMGFYSVSIMPALWTSKTQIIQCILKKKELIWEEEYLVLTG